MSSRRPPGDGDSSRAAGLPSGCQEIGGQLASVRASRQLSVADVASRLILSKAQVLGLETGDVSAFYGTAFFLKGLRKYMAFAELPTDGLDLALARAAEEEAETLRLAQADAGVPPALRLVARVPRGAWIAAAVVIVIGLMSMLAAGNRRGRLAVAFIVIGAILACGTQGPFGWLYQWAFETVPLFNTMREPAKWLGLIQLGFIIAMAAGVRAIQDWDRAPTLRRPLAIVACCLPLTVLPALAWGLGGRVATSTYPADWQTAAAQLDPAPARALFLPWHGYQPFPFTDERTVATPAAAFFPGTILSSSAVEVGPLRSGSASTQQAVMDDLVAAGGGADFAGSLSRLGVTHVIVSLGLEDDRYAWVAEQPGLTLVDSGPDVALFRVDVPVPGLDRLRSAGPARFTVEPGVPGTVIVPVEYSTGWQLDGAPGTKTPEGTVSFEVGAGPAEIVYAPWSSIRIGIIVSLAALLLIFIAGLMEHWADLRPRSRRTTPERGTDA